MTTSKSMRFSFKRKVSSFLFSTNKKSTKEKYNISQPEDESHCSVAETSTSLVNSTGALKDDVSQSFNGSGFEDPSESFL